MSAALEQGGGAALEGYRGPSTIPSPRGSGERAEGEGRSGFLGAGTQLVLLSVDAPPVDLALIHRRALRQTSTDAEMVLWNQLRAKRVRGFKFRRQHSRGPYILDFYCANAGVAIELDGGQHYDEAAQAYDARRTAFLRASGIEVIRFPNDAIFTEREAVLEAISVALARAPLPSPSPRFAGRGERGR